MYLLFLDESGQLSERKFFALGGIAIRAEDWRLLHHIWHEVLAKRAWPAEREVKWHGIRKGEVAPALADEVVAALVRAPLTFYVTLLDIELGLDSTPEFFALLNRPAVRRPRRRDHRSSGAWQRTGSGLPKTLWPRFAIHPVKGEVEGVGLKRFPERVQRTREATKLF